MPDPSQLKYVILEFDTNVTTKSLDAITEAMSDIEETEDLHVVTIYHAFDDRFGKLVRVDEDDS